MINRIKNLCKKNNINIAKLEKETGLSNGQIGKWKERQPRADLLYNVAKYFNVSMEYILIGKEEENPEETKLINNYRIADERGKRRISNLAEEEAQEQLSLTSSNGEETKINEA